MPIRYTEGTTFEFDFGGVLHADDLKHPVDLICRMLQSQIDGLHHQVVPDA